jgi:hypothetical protein
MVSSRILVFGILHTLAWGDCSLEFSPHSQSLFDFLGKHEITPTDARGSDVRGQSHIVILLSCVG